MVMAEDDVLQKVLFVSSGGGSVSGSEPLSPWKTPVDNPADSTTVMASDTWPALSDVQRAKNSEGSAKSPPPDTKEVSPSPLPPLADSQVITDFLLALLLLICSSVQPSILIGTVRMSSRRHA